MIIFYLRFIYHKHQPNCRYINIYIYIMHGSYGFQGRKLFDKPFLSDGGEQALMKPIFCLDFFRSSSRSFFCNIQRKCFC